MGYVLRTSQDNNNPTLSGGVYGKYITIGKAIYWYFDGSRTRGIIFIADGGRYGLDSVQSVEYKGASLSPADWVFHPGTLPAQIQPKVVTVAGSVFTSVGHGYINGDKVRLRSVDGDLPQPLEIGIHGQSKIYFVVNKTVDTFQLSLTLGGAAINLTTAGTGSLRVWKANAGFDDTSQGLPTFSPETESTFSNIAYIEFKLSPGQSSAADPPDWQDFRVYGLGRRLMDYDENGNELGLVPVQSELLFNTPLQIADNLLVNYKVKHQRNDWQSWKAFRDKAFELIWQRANSEDPAPEQGFTGRYFQNQDFTDLKVTRLDDTINLNGSLSVPPAPNMTTNGFSVIWTGQILPRYTETYTISCVHDDGVQVFVNSQMIINNAGVGTHSGQISLVADQPCQIEVRFVQIQISTAPNDYYCNLRWQSASQVLETIPASRTQATDQQVRRYECHTAFNAATEASEVHERLMERCPGYDWTDDDGLIKYLPPTRPVVFAFKFDKIDNDSKANFANKFFKKKKRPLSDRENFKLAKYRRSDLESYPYRYARAYREDLLRLTDGNPSNDAASDFGVMTRSLAERMIEYEMVIKSDPKHITEVLGFLDSSKIRKNQLVTMTYFDNNGNYVTDERHLATFHSWGASNNANQFALLPIAEIFYSDEPVVDDFGDALTVIIKKDGDGKDDGGGDGLEVGA